jgi:regulatory protein
MEGSAKKITALKERKGREKIVDIYLDGSFAFRVTTELAAKEGLRIEQPVSDERVEELKQAQNFHKCLYTAARYISYRPRSEAEIRSKLQKRGFDSESREAAIATLKEEHLLDDTVFAKFWTENRDSFSPRSQRLTRLELLRKGVSKSAVAEATSEINDEENAYQAAQNKIRSLAHYDYDSFCRKLGGYLQRRGFGYGVINHTVERVAKEMGLSQKGVIE